MHRGGEGVVRDIEFRIPVQVSILSERRVYHPYGLEGGGDAACGLNLWARKVVTDEQSDAQLEDEFRYINMGAKNTASMRPGERIIIHTPGGGAWGKEGEQSQVQDKKDPRAGWKGGSVAGRQSTAEASA